ncbi:hypothetical protein FHY09_001594 [Xanthomonas sp. 60]
MTSTHNTGSLPYSISSIAAGQSECAGQASLHEIFIPMPPKGFTASGPSEPVVHGPREDMKVEMTKLVEFAIVLDH